MEEWLKRGGGGGGGRRDINIERVEMIALTYRQGSRSAAVPVTGAMGAILVHNYTTFPYSARKGDCRPIRENRMGIRPTASSLTGTTVPIRDQWWVVINALLYGYAPL